MGRKVDVLIEISSGILEDVAVLSKEKARKVWTRWGKEHGYSNYPEFLRAIQEGRAEEELRWFSDFDIDEEGFTKKKKEFNPSERGHHETNR